MKILLVEDDKNVARFVEKGLQGNSFSVDSAGNGEDGVHLAIEENYDLIILDIMLPFLSGDKIHLHLRERGNTTPVIFLTAGDSAEIMVDGFYSGDDDYSVKPFFFS